jgi:hypothetical protein
MQTYGAQTGANIGTAIANTALNQVNQVTPYGNLNYTQRGTYKFTDPLSGKTYNLPQYTATQSLSPIQQQILDQTQGAQLNLGQIANERSAFLQDYLAKPFSLDNSAVEGRLFDLGRQQLDPVFARQQQNLEQSLANRGIKMGSGAYQQQMEDFGKTRGSAYNDLLLRGHQVATQDLLTERNQPLQEINALLSGSQVSQPGYVNTPQSQVANVDYAGLVANNYNQQMSAYNQRQQMFGDIVGGLFGLGSGFIRR